LKGNVRFYLILALIGAAWGSTFPISKVAVSTGYQPFGIMVWQTFIAILLTGIFLKATGKSLRLSRRYFGLYFGVALLGIVLSGYFSYAAAPHLPAGVLAIIIAISPLFAFPIALALGFERFSISRLIGLGFGAVAVAVLVVPATSLPDPDKAAFVLVAMLATLAYGAEGNFLAWFNTRADLNFPSPIKILFGASVIAFVLSVPLAYLSGQFIDPIVSWRAPEWGILAISVLSTGAYSGYIWLVHRTGPVFAAQVAYLVTGFGVLWAILLLDEAYSGWVWSAMAVMMVGLFLVTPRTKATLAESP
jgi:drug/metabolite transporter (DMT)-like permease